jgi:hypothetical protein
MVQSQPIAIAGHTYTPETLDLLRSVLEEAWASLSEFQQTQFPRSQLAERLLKAAAAGERDRSTLLTQALDGLVAPLVPN